jgi:heme iron utilization protein
MNQIAKAQAEYENFSAQFGSIILSTVDAEGLPNASYTPFVMDAEKRIYIYVSGLATHTKNIYANPRVSVLFIEDETQTKQIFARRRLSFDCEPNLLVRDTPQWLGIIEKFQEKFGGIIEMLHSLPDFRIFQLTPTSGRFVIGFGAAYQISGDNLHQLTQITD